MRFFFMVFFCGLPLDAAKINLPSGKKIVSNVSVPIESAGAAWDVLLNTLKRQLKITQDGMNILILLQLTSLEMRVEWNIQECLCSWESKGADL
jgi:hypothetical protein